MTFLRWLRGVSPNMLRFKRNGSAFTSNPQMCLCWLRDYSSTIWRLFRLTNGCAFVAWYPRTWVLTFWQPRLACPMLSSSINTPYEHLSSAFLWFALNERRQKLYWWHVSISNAFIVGVYCNAFRAVSWLCKLEYRYLGLSALMPSLFHHVRHQLKLEYLAARA